jgi:hypothetical protein
VRCRGKRGVEFGPLVGAQGGGSVLELEDPVPAGAEQVGDEAGYGLVAAALAVLAEMGGIASDAAFRRLAQTAFPQLSRIFGEQSRSCATSLTKPLAPA